MPTRISNSTALVVLVFIYAVSVFLLFRIYLVAWVSPQDGPTGAAQYIGDAPHYETLAKFGQSPDVMVVSCSDSRVDPETIFTAMPGELCMPYSTSQGNRSNNPSASIASAPPRPSSAG